MCLYENLYLPELYLFVKTVQVLAVALLCLEAVVSVGRAFFFLLQKEQCVLLNRENKQVCQVHGENSIKCSGLATGADRLDTNCKEEIEKIYNAVTVGTLSSSCVPKHTLLLLQYWLLLGVRGYVFGPIEEKGNITSPVSIKCERQIRLHYCLGE